LETDASVQHALTQLSGLLHREQVSEIMKTVQKGGLVYVFLL